MAIPRRALAVGSEPKTLWCKCGKASIMAPAGATPKTRYVCPSCAERALRRRGVSPARVHFDEPKGELSALRISG